jgi:hypothetical protein
MRVFCNIGADDGTRIHTLCRGADFKSDFGRCQMLPLVPVYTFTH